MSAGSHPIVPSAPAVYRRLLDVLDDVLEDGVPRAAIVGTDAAAVIAGWQHAIENAETVAAAVRPALGQGQASPRSLARLVVAASAVAGMARASGLDAPMAAGDLPAFAALRRALDAAYAHARRTSPGGAPDA